MNPVLCTMHNQVGPQGWFHQNIARFHRLGSLEYIDIIYNDTISYPINTSVQIPKLYFPKWKEFCIG